MNTSSEEKLKSWILLAAGLFGIGYQQWSGKTDWVLLLIFTAMTGVPGLTKIISLIKTSPIVLQSSLPQQERSAQVLESSSSNSLDDSSA